jgi:hypothetical protein
MTSDFHDTGSKEDVKNKLLGGGVNVLSVKRSKEQCTDILMETYFIMSSSTAPIIRRLIPSG